MSSDARRPQVPADMKAFNDKLIEEFRANHGKLRGRMANSQILLLTTTGSRSGAQRTTVIGYRPYGENLAVIASNNGAAKSPSWFFNLLANPVATVEVGPNKFQVRARVHFSRYGLAFFGAAAAATLQPYPSAWRRTRKPSSRRSAGAASDSARVI